tara:strand:- start:2834 stop:3505 length:672 start_codon:yes stop_codon:yes gene_type:complete
MEYDFIEIGTSDFNTLIENADDNTRGLSIEPIQTYLDNLPNKKNVKKICLGISNCNKMDKIFYVKPENITKYNFPNWLRGCNSISKPHPSHFLLNLTINNFRNKSPKILKRPESYNFELNKNGKAIVESQDIEIIDTKELIKRYNIEKVKYLKLDTEGHDCVILLDYIKNCILNPSLFPNKILFENNRLTLKKNSEEVIKAFQIHGYKVEILKADIKLTKINN